MAKFEEQLKEVKSDNENLHETIFEAEKREDQYKQDISTLQQDSKSKEESMVKELSRTKAQLTTLQEQNEELTSQLENELSQLN